jgi:hypothetical protein
LGQLAAHFQNTILALEVWSIDVVVNASVVYGGFLPFRGEFRKGK